MHLLNDVAHLVRLLEHALGGGPDLAGLHGGEVLQHRAEGQKIVQRVELGGDGAVVNYHVGGAGVGIELLHAHVDGGQLAVVVQAQVTEHVLTPGDADHGGHVAVALVGDHVAAGADVEEGGGFAGGVQPRQGADLLRLGGKGRFRLRLPAQQHAVDLHPLRAAQGMVFVAGALHHRLDTQLRHLVLHLGIVEDHGGLDGQLAAAVKQQLVIRGVVLAGVGEPAAVQGLNGGGGVPVLAAHEGDGVHAADGLKKGHGGGGGKIDMVKALGHRHDVPGQARRGLLPPGHH